jgi:chromosome partitioning protein
MKTVALVSQKGGAGKTTLAVHLCAEAAASGMRALLIDLDPQASAALWGDLRGDLGPDVATEHPARLDAAMKAAREQGYDIAVLDTAPHADQAALKAAKLADLVLVPCRPATFDLGAIKATLELCEIAKRRALVVLNAAPIRSRVVEAARLDIANDGATVCEAIVRQRVAFQHCLSAGQVAREYEPDGSAAREIAELWQHISMFSWEHV